MLYLKEQTTEALFPCVCAFSMFYEIEHTNDYIEATNECTNSL